MGALIEESLLSWITFIPLATGVALLTTGLVASFLLGSHGFPAAVWRLVGFGGSIVTFALALSSLWNRFDPEASGFQFVERVPWIPELGVNYFVGVDGISLPLVLLISFLVPVLFLASWKQPARSARTGVFLVLLFETTLIGSLVALNLFQFVLFFELSLLPVLFMIGIWGDRERKRAATRLAILSGVGSAAMLLGLAALASMNLAQNAALLGESATRNLDLVLATGGQGVALLDTRVGVSGEVWWRTQAWLFGAFALGFGIRAALFPVHGVLSHAHEHGPTIASVLHGAGLLGLGSYGFLRFALPLFPQASAGEAFGRVFVVLAVVAILYGSLVALVQRDLKRLIAYVSIAQLGFVVLGIFALNTHGLTGSVVQIVAHGLASCALLVLAGFLYERRGTRLIADFGGLARVLPVFAACFGLATMASLGVPGLGIFAGEFLVLLGAFAANPLAASLATLGLLLIAAALLWMFRRLIFGPIEHDENRGLIDLDWRERTAVIALLIPLIWIGVNPNPLLRRIEPSVIETLERMQRAGAPLRLEQPWAPSPAPSPEPEAEPVDAPEPEAG